MTGTLEQLKTKPKREDFNDQIVFELALIDYWYCHYGKNHPLRSMVESMEANLRCKLGMTLPEGN